jgi:hypothetical protein
MNPLKKLLILTCFIFQVFFGISQFEYIVEIDPDNNSFSPIGNNLPGVIYYYGGTHTINENENLLYFIKTFPDSILHVNLLTGEIENSVPCSYFNGDFSFRSMHYNHLDGMIYGIHFDQVAGAFFLGKTDPNVGNVDMIGDFIPGSYGYTTEGITINPEDNLIYCHSANFMDDRIYVISLETGEILSQSQLNFGNNQYLWTIEFDTSQGQLFGTMGDMNLLLNYPILIYPESGNFDIIGNGYSGSSHVLSSTSIDHENRIYYLQGGYGDMSGYSFQGIDLESGELIYNDTLIQPNEWSDNGPNVTSAEYNNTLNKLIGLHWGDISSVDIPEHAIISNVKLYPNPGDGIVHIDGLKCSSDSYLEIFNQNGQKVLSEKIISPTKSLDLSGISPGIYQIVIHDENGKHSHRIFLI